MALAKAYSVSLFGLGGKVIEVEADISSNLPNFVLVGLPDASLSESTSRVRAACANSGLSLPARRITVNLSPASVPKQGSGFDLSIAVAVLAAAGSLNARSVQRFAHFGELGLDGSLRPIGGILPMILASKKAGFSRAVVPLSNQAEAQLVEGMEIMGCACLAEVARLHGADISVAQREPEQLRVETAPDEPQPCMSEVFGQPELVDALKVAAAGRHHLLMVGPPGAGKTMLAERLPTILPQLTVEEALEVAAVRSIARVETVTGLVTQPPFEAPHHSSSMVAMIGGGSGVPKPGLISLAHNGVLFLDETPEFSSQTLESLRQPLESGKVTINRASGSAWFPARFQLALAANPCPCGNYSAKGNRCTCSHTQRSRYLAKLSGPLLDRIDIRLDVRPASSGAIAVGKARPGPTSAQIRQQVQEARQRARHRLAGTAWHANAEITGAYLRKHLRPPASATARLDEALARGQISMRAYDRCLKVAWTCADLAARDQVTSDDILCALSLRANMQPEPSQ